MVVMGTYCLRFAKSGDGDLARALAGFFLQGEGAKPGTIAPIFFCFIMCGCRAVYSDG